MSNISFKTGTKEYVINGDENKKIYVNPSDIGMLERIEKGIKDLETAAGAVDNSEQALKQLDVIVKKTIDYIFDSSVSSVVFGNASSVCLST